MVECIGETSSAQSSKNRLVSHLPHLGNLVLPSVWSAKDKHAYIGLSNGNLRAAYKSDGSNKNHKDAGAVRTNHPIPTACGLYYFEITVISKGRDGFMGVGISSQSISLNRLPGWDRVSVGYHGDDGHSFVSSGTGQPYGPTFTTNDVIGCGINFLERTCFFTKNGINLGVACSDIDLEKAIYPTIGLQTPGEIIEANFGQEDFVFDIDQVICEITKKLNQQIEAIHRPFEMQSTLNQLVSSYLVCHGHAEAANAFAQATGQSLGEEATSISNRQLIQKYVLSGNISHAIFTTKKLYPGLLEKNPSLLFQLKCRQFVEIISGVDSLQEPEEIDGLLPEARCVEPMHTDDEDEVIDHAMTNGVEEVNLKDPLEQIITAGRELRLLYEDIKTSSDNNSENEQLMHDVFSLVAYSDPKSSRVSHHFLQERREIVYNALNGAILDACGLQRTPPIHILLSHVSECLDQMTSNGLGARSFVQLDQIVK